MSNDQQLSDDEIWAMLPNLQGNELYEAYGELSSRAFDRNDYDRCITLAGRCAEIAIANGAERVAAEEYFRIGAAANNNDQLAESIVAYQQAADLYQSLGMQEFLSDTYTRMASVHFRSRSYEESLKVALSGLTVAEAEEQTHTAGHAALYAAKALYHLDREQEALEMTSRSRDLFRENSDMVGVSQVDDFTATVHDFLGNYEAAVAALRNCWHISEAVDGSPTPYSSRRLGNALAQVEQHDDALVHLRTARDGYQQRRQYRMVAFTDRDIAENLWDTGQIEEAKSTFARAQSLFDSIGEVQLARRCAIFRSEIAYGEGDFANAARLVRQVLADIDSDPKFDDQAWRYWAQLHLMDDLAELGDFDGVIELSQSMRDEDAAYDSQRIERRTLATRALLALDRRDEALELADSTLSLNQESLRTSDTAYLYEARGRILLDRGNQAGEKDLTHAIAIHLRAERDDHARELAEYFIPVKPGIETATDPAKEPDED